MRNLIGLFIVLAALVALSAQNPPAPDLSMAPPVPAGVGIEPRCTWHPKLDANATAVVLADGTVIDYRGGGDGTPVLSPANRSPLGIALDLCANDDGDWVGFYGTWPYELKLGDGTGPRETARLSGYRGVSLIGLNQDPSDSDCSVLWGLHLSQKTGTQADIALIGCVIDSHSIMPIQTMDLANPPFGNIWLEDLRFLTISNDQAHANPAGKTATTRVIRGHGAARWHVVDCEMLDGYVIGDRQAGASEHFAYWDGQQGDSEFIGCKIRGPQWAGMQAVGRYTDRMQLPSGTWIERFPYGKLRIEDCWFENVGSAGTACINITGGGLLEVTVTNCTYSAGFIQTGSSGQVGPKGWLGMAIQTYTDHKAWELDEVNYPAGQGPILGRGYSMEPTTNPASPGPPPLLDDGFGACRSIVVIGGTWRRNGGGSPLFSFRDCKDVQIVQQAQGSTPLVLSGGPIMFCPNGVLEQCGKAGSGPVPAGSGTGYWQQARFISRRAPSTWITVPVKMGTSRKTLIPVDLDKWN